MLDDFHKIGRHLYAVNPAMCELCVFETLYNSQTSLVLV